MEPEEAIKAAVGQAMAVPNPPPKKPAAGKKAATEGPAPRTDEKKGKGKKEGPKRVSEGLSQGRGRG